jgi:Flp pilus assembly protein TadG
MERKQKHKPGKLNRFFHLRSFILQTKRSETGQTYIELVMVLPLFLMVIAALILFGRVLYVKMALDMTSYDACRAAVEALRPGDGVSQGMIAGQATLRGFYLNPTGANISVSPAGRGAWTRGIPVRCVAAYDLFVGDIPGLSDVAVGSGVPLQSTTWSRVELWRSDWR